jgi:hypothetical protein
VDAVCPPDIIAEREEADMIDDRLAATAVRSVVALAPDHVQSRFRQSKRDWL